MVWRNYGFVPILGSVPRPDYHSGQPHLPAPLHRRARPDARLRPRPPGATPARRAGAHHPRCRARPARGAVRHDRRRDGLRQVVRRRGGGVLLRCQAGAGPVPAAPDAQMGARDPRDGARRAGCHRPDDHRPGAPPRGRCPTDAGGRAARPGTPHSRASLRRPQPRGGEALPSLAIGGDRATGPPGGRGGAARTLLPGLLGAGHRRREHPADARGGGEEEAPVPGLWGTLWTAAAAPPPAHAQGRPAFPSRAARSRHLPAQVGPRTYPLADYIRRRLPGYFDLLVVDEATSSKGAAQPRGARRGRSPTRAARR